MSKWNNVKDKLTNSRLYKNTASEQLLLNTMDIIVDSVLMLEAELESKDKTIAEQELEITALNKELESDVKFISDQAYEISSKDGWPIN